MKDRTANPKKKEQTPQALLDLMRARTISSAQGEKN
jgi:hypothetical protein